MRKLIAAFLLAGRRTVFPGSEDEFLPINSFHAVSVHQIKYGPMWLVSSFISNLKKVSRQRLLTRIK